MSYVPLMMCRYCRHMHERTHFADCVCVPFATQISYMLDTEDTMLRKRRKTTSAALDAARESRLVRFGNWLEKQNAEKPAEDEEAAARTLAAAALTAGSTQDA